MFVTCVPRRYSASTVSVHKPSVNVTEGGDSVELTGVFFLEKQMREDDKCPSSGVTSYGSLGKGCQKARLGVVSAMRV